MSQPLPAYITLNILRADSRHQVTVGLFANHNNLLPNSCFYGSRVVAFHFLFFSSVTNFKLFKSVYYKMFVLIWSGVSVKQIIKVMYLRRLATRWQWLAKRVDAPHSSDCYKLITSRSTVVLVDASEFSLFRWLLLAQMNCWSNCTFCMVHRLTGSICITVLLPQTIDEWGHGWSYILQFLV